MIPLSKFLIWLTIILWCRFFYFYLELLVVTIDFISVKKLCDTHAVLCSSSLNSSSPYIVACLDIITISSKIICSHRYIEILTYTSSKHFRVLRDRDRMVHCGLIYNYLCNQNLSSLKLWVRTPFIARSTRYNTKW